MKTSIDTQNCSATNCLHGEAAEVERCNVCNIVVDELRNSSLSSSKNLMSWFVLKAVQSCVSRLKSMGPNTSLRDPRTQFAWVWYHSACLGRKCFLFYSQVHKYWDVDTVRIILAVNTTAMDLKLNKQDVLEVQTYNFILKTFTSKPGERCTNYITGFHRLWCNRMNSEVFWAVLLICSHIQNSLNCA